MNSGFSNSIGHTFAQTVGAVSLEPKRYTFSLEHEKSFRMEGLSINVDANGAIWGASYDSGEAVRHNSNYSMAKGLNNTLWLGDRRGLWHPID